MLEVGSVGAKHTKNLLIKVRFLLFLFLRKKHGAFVTDVAV